MKRIYNLKKQKEDTRDFIHKVSVPEALPLRIDLRPLCPLVFDQGDLGSCTANAGVAALIMLKNAGQMFSRIFQYYNERSIEGTTKTDNGASMRDIGKAIQKYGICLEITEPYDVTKFNHKPTPHQYAEALHYKCTSYASIDNDIEGIKAVLATQSKPVLMGIDVYTSFESAVVAKTGIVPMPAKGEKVLGGHAILAVGYDEVKKVLICRNSWGSSWGDKGYFYLPYEYVTTGFASSFWVLN
jgi:C1A family cysteine protease